MDDFFGVYWDIQKYKNCRDKVTVHGKYKRFSPLVDIDNPSETHRLWLKIARGKNSILDCGAGDLRLKDYLLRNGYKGRYKTFDIGKSFCYDYDSLETVQESFDLIFCLEVIEHLPLEKAFALLERLKGILTDKGVLVLSTPNIHHLNHFWRTDVTHVRPYPYEDLLAMIFYLGFSSVELYRIVWWRENTLAYSLRFLMKRFLTFVLETDYATNIAMICQK